METKSLTPTQQAAVILQKFQNANESEKFDLYVRVLELASEVQEKLSQANELLKDALHELEKYKELLESYNLITNSNVQTKIQSIEKHLKGDE